MMMNRIEKSKKTKMIESSKNENKNRMKNGNGNMGH